MLEQDARGIKVLKLVDGRIFKFFRRKRWWSSARWRPYSSRFCANALRLQALGVPTVVIDAHYRLENAGETAVLYQPLPGDTLRQIGRRGEFTMQVQEALGTFVASLHEKGVYFRSLHMGNVVCTSSGAFGLIDIADMQIRARPLSPSLRLRNFRHMCRLDEDKQLWGKSGWHLFANSYVRNLKTHLPDGYVRQIEQCYLQAKKPEAVPPSGVLEKAAKVILAAQPIPDWQLKMLTTTNPVWRIKVDEYHWIIKQSRNADKDVLVSHILHQYGVPDLGVVLLDKDWVLMRFAGEYNLETLPAEFFHVEMFTELGRLAALALLLGMRDRKLANIAVSPESATNMMCHIDYEGAFRTGLLNRTFRPAKYFRYLLTRLLFDVARKFQVGNLDGAYELFKSGFLAECGRISNVAPANSLRGKIALKMRWVLCTFPAERSRLETLLDHAHTKMIATKSRGI